jgi:hypothetical protein
MLLTKRPLAANETYEQPGRDRFEGNDPVGGVRGLVYASHAGTLYLEESDDDGTTWSQTGDAVSVAAKTTTELLWTNLTKQQYRFRYVNGATAQTKFRLVQQTRGLELVSVTDTVTQAALASVLAALQDTLTMQLSGSIMGKDPTGNAKGINVNENGDLQSVIVGGKTQIAVFNKDSLPTTYYSPDFFEPRDTSNKVFYLPHVYIGVFEQAIGIRSTLDVPVTLSIKCVVNAGDGDKTGATIWTGTVPTDARFYFVSDMSDSVVETSSQKIIGLIELRLPFVYFIIDVNASSPPTTGQIMVQSVRRY